MDWTAMNSVIFVQFPICHLLLKKPDRIITLRLNSHFDIVAILPSIQSVYHRNFLMETTLTRVISDLLMAADVGDMSVLALLDLGAALDTVDHSVLLQ